jgi:hypothetical protein
MVENSLSHFDEGVDNYGSHLLIYIGIEVLLHLLMVIVGFLTPSEEIDKTIDKFVCFLGR